MHNLARSKGPLGTFFDIFLGGIEHARAGRSTRSTYCLHRRLLGSTGLVGNLAGVSRSWILGYSTCGHIDTGSRWFFHIPGYPTAAASNRRAFITYEKQPIGQSWDADRIYAAAVHASARSCNGVSFELVLSRANDPAGSALSSFCFSLWHAHVPAFGRDTRQQRCCHCTLLSWIIQSRWLDLWPDAVRFCVDSPHCSPR